MMNDQIALKSRRPGNEPTVVAGHWPLFLLVVSLLVLSGCAGTPKVNSLHDPLYRAQTHVSTISVQAEESRDGIDQIRIDVTVGEITACTDSMGLLPSLIPCRRNAFSFAVLCNYPAIKTEVGCSVPLNLGPRRLVTYQATARSARGRTGRSGPISYAAGAPLTSTTIRFPFVNITMPWETARPVIWRTETPARNAAIAGKIDFGFVPNSDMPNYRAFTDDLQPMVLPLFYTDDRPYARFTRTWRNFFNLWAGPNGANASGCTRNFSGSAATVRAAFDGTGILHRNAFRDCASISLGGGAGTAQTTLSDGPWVLLHEAGHFLFGLGDEYDGGGNVSVSNPRNVFPNQAQCQTTSTANGLPSGQCVEIGSTGTWRNDDGQDTTMEDRTTNSDWRTLSGRALNNLIGSCGGGNCY